MSLDIKNAAEFIKGVGEFEKNLDKAVGEIYRGWTVKIFQQAVRTTPQWTGSAASNWNYSVGTINSHFETYKLETAKEIEDLTGEFKPLQKGHPEAVTEAFFSNSGKDGKVKLQGGLLPTVYINNPSQSLTGRAYAQKLEDNVNGFLRAVNEPGHMVRDTAYRFGTMGKLQLSQRNALKETRI